MPVDFTLNDKYGTPHPLNCLDVDKGSKTLGIFIIMDGNQTDQLNNVREISEVFAEQIRTSYCNKNIVIYTYTNCFIKSVEYYIPVSNFSKTEWNNIVALSKKCLLQQARIASTFQLNVLYGPHLYISYNLDHPYFKQGIKKMPN